MNIKILIVDDMPHMRRSLRNMLGQLGFSQIIEAADGAEAFAALKSGGYGLCITDWNMQPVDGLELVKMVRSDMDLHAMPLIMVSTEGRSEKIRLAMDAGVNDYLVKPYDTEKLASKIELLLGSLPQAA